MSYLFMIYYAVGLGSGDYCTLRELISRRVFSSFHIVIILSSFFVRLYPFTL